MLFAAPSLGVSLKSRWAQCALAFPSGLDLASTTDPGSVGAIQVPSVEYNRGTKGRLDASSRRLSGDGDRRWDRDKKIGLWCWAVVSWWSLVRSGPCIPAWTLWLGLRRPQR